MSSNTPSTTTSAAKKRAARTFVQELKRLAGIRRATAGTTTIGEKNLGALAALRRGLGKAPGTAPEMYPYVMPYLPEGASRREEDAYFLVAALFAFYQQGRPVQEDYDTSLNLGASYRRLANSTDSKSLEKRFVTLLDARREDLPEHLRHAIGLLKAKGVPVDWVRLLRDVSAWDPDNRRVQRAWARAYWGRPPSDVTAGQVVNDSAQDDDTL